MKNIMVEYYELIDSTNNRCIELGNNQKEEFSLVIADRQTAGRGRNGHVWSSNDDAGLYFSVLLKPKMDITKVSMMTLVMAYSVNRFLTENNINSKIKWPNDIVVNGKKICGILSEMRLIPQTNEYFVVIGVGLNVGNKVLEFDNATSVFLETNENWAPNKELKIKLAQRIIDCFKKDYENVIKDDSLYPILADYESMLVNINKVCRIINKDTEFEAEAIGITSNGCLRIKTEEGTISEISSGEVSVRGIYGYVD